MLDEPVVNNDTEPLVQSDQTSDSALSAAYDALFSDNTEEPVQVAPPVVEEPVVPVEEPISETPPEQLTHEESSRLGRKVAELSNKMVTREDLDAILKKLENLQAPTSPQFAPVTPDPFTKAEQEEISDITDVKELDSYLDRREQRKAREAEQQVATYRQGYIKSLQDFSNGLDKDTFNEVFQVMKGKYNDVLSGDPVRDCAVNFAQAVKEVSVAQLKKTSTNPFDKNLGVTPVTPTTPSIVTNTTSVEMPQLDPIAAEFVKRVGMSADVVKKTLEGDMKTSLTGKKKTF
jgi:hypothetical protein